MRCSLWLVGLATLIDASLAAVECVCEDHSYPLNFVEISRWMMANDASHPETPPPKVQCPNSKPGPDCPKESVETTQGSDVDVIKKGMCSIYQRVDGKPIIPEDRAHWTSTHACDDPCKEEIAREAAKGHSTMAACSVAPGDNRVVVGGAYKQLIGDCMCNPSGGVALSDAIIDIFMEALPMIGEIIKDVWLQAFTFLLTLPLNAVPGVGGALGAAISATITAAKLCSYAYRGATAARAFVNWGKAAGKLGKDIDKTFDKATNRPDGDWKPPPGLTKGSGRDGDKGAPKDWDKRDDGSDAIDKKDDKPGDDKPKKCDKKVDKDCKDDDDDKKSSRPSPTKSDTQPSPSKSNAQPSASKSDVQPSASKSGAQPSVSKSDTRPSASTFDTRVSSQTPTKTSSGSQSASSSSRSSSASSSSTGQPCSASCKSCGGGKLNPPLGIRPPNALDPLNKRVLRGPEDTGGNVVTFFMQELPKAEFLDIHSTNGNGDSTAFRFDLGNDAFTKAVTGLYGCTSLVLASKSRVWMSHFWEIPSFRTNEAGWQKPRRPEDKVKFQSQVLDQMLKGGPMSDKMPGWESDTKEGGPFHPSQDVHWLVMTPHDFNNKNRPRYPYEVDEIVKQLKRYFPDATRDDGRVVLYEAKSDPKLQKEGPTGKILFQYDPDHRTQKDEATGTVAQMAAWRIWAGERGISTFMSEWKATPEQIFGKEHN